MKYKDGDNNGFTTWCLALLWLCFVFFLGYQTSHQRLAVAGVYGIYELLWEIMNDSLVYRLRRHIIFMEYLNPEDKNQSNSIFELRNTQRDAYKGELMKLANYLSLTPSQLKLRLLIHYLPKLIMLYFFMEETFTNPRELTFLPSPYYT